MAIIALALLTAGACSCAYKPRAPEPALDISVYVYNAEQSMVRQTPTFINAQGHNMEASDLLIFDFGLIPLSDLQKIQEKIERCEVWR